MSGTLRLRGATSGYSELQAPAVAADQTFILPTAGGTLLTTDSPVAKLTLELGSASQPSLTFEGDTDTGLYSSGTNTLNLVTGGSDRLVIDSSGNVGIGTSLPDTKLHVLNPSGGASTTEVCEIERDNSGYFLKINRNAGSGNAGGLIGADSAGTYFTGGHNTNNMLYIDAGNSVMQFYANSAERMRIDSSGNVDIGTTTARAGLTVALGSASIPAAGASTGSAVFSNATDGATYGVVVGANTSGIGYIQSQRTDGTATTYDLAIQPNGGSVGIGTAAPSQILELKTGEPRLCLNGTTATGDKGIEFDHNGTRYGHLFHNYNSGELSISSGDNGSAYFITFKTDNSERMRIDSSGNLGIGTSSPTSVLHVKSDTANDNFNGIVFEAAASTNRVFRLIENSTGEAYSSWFNANTEKVRIRANGASFFDGGYVGIGTTSPTRHLHVHESSSGVNAYIQLSNANSGTGTGDGLQIIVTDSDAIIAQRENLPLDFRTNDTDRMRIRADGTRQHHAPYDVDTASTTQSAGSSWFLYRGRHSATGIGGGTTSFIVWSNGDVDNTNNSYGAISDVKLKENIVDATSQWDDLKTIKIRKYNFKEETGHQTHTQLGVVAQEVELVSPGLVTESPDRDDEGNDLGTTTKSVNYSVLYMKAVKALQEAMARIETLEANNLSLENRIAALENN